MMQLAFPQGPELQHATQTGKRVGQRSVPHSSSRPETTENSLGWLHSRASHQIDPTDTLCYCSSYGR